MTCSLYVNPPDFTSGTQNGTFPDVSFVYVKEGKAKFSHT